MSREESYPPLHAALVAPLVAPQYLLEVEMSSRTYDNCPECGSEKVSDTEAWDSVKQVETYPVAYCEVCGWDDLEEG